MLWLKRKHCLYCQRKLPSFRGFKSYCDLDCACDHDRILNPHFWSEGINGPIKIRHPEIRLVGRREFP